MDILKLLEYGLGTALTIGLLVPLVWKLVKTLIDDRQEIMDLIQNHFQHYIQEQKEDINVKHEIAAHMAVTNEILREFRDRGLRDGRTEKT